MNEVTRAASEEEETILKEIYNLRPESKARMMEITKGICEGKTTWEILTCAELPLYLACYPKYIFEYIYVFITQFIKNLFRIRLI